MKHHGNVTKINGAEVEPVDIITFGSPCQDLSVAGKRAGIQDGERSNLFFEAIRIIKEMRDSTNGEYPKYAVWENVPGAFSSNKGHDFHAVLEALCSVCDDTVSIPRPYDPKRPDNLVWNKAGEIVGDSYSIAWRTLDAQYWGVPQRRKRIYLVADFTGRCAGEILFKPESLRGDLSQGDETGQEVTADAVGGVDGSVGVECLGFDMYNQSSTGDKTRTLKTPVGGDDLPVVCYAPDKASTLRANAGAPKHMADILGRLVVLNDQGGSSINVEQEEISPTLRANSHQHEPVIAIDHVITTGGNCTAQGSCVYEHTQATLKAGGVHAVCYDARGNGGGAKQYLFENHSQDTRYKGPLDVSPIVSATFGMGGNNQPFVIQEEKPPRRYIIRRLTPTECARLQGFPDWWSTLAPYNPADAEFWEDVRKTHAEINGKKYKPVKDLKKWYDKLHTDNAEYKMWGNGIALPNAEYVLHGIAEQGAKTLGSLFDGSGGFPLAGVLNGIKPIWASEVEPYCIAVTKSRFKEAPMSELKKCPFCGGEANLDELTPTPYNDQHSTYYSVGCINCGIGFYENTEQEAIAAWNRRADGWIPVGERVPDADEHMVLAIVNGKPQKNVTLHGAYMLAEYSEKEGWILDNYPEWEKADVTHWMPLPASPKGE